MADTAPCGPAEALPLLDGGRRLLIDLGNTKTALLLAEGEKAVARAEWPTASIDEAAVRGFLCPPAVRSPGAGYSVDAANGAAQAASIAAANAASAGREAPATLAGDGPDAPVGAGAANASGDAGAPGLPPPPAGCRPLAPRPPAPVFISSVVPALDAPLAGWLRACGWDDVTFADSAKGDIIPHRLTAPQTAGSDRLLAALAASALFSINPRKEPVVVIQAGTAVVVDLVDAKGVFLGGVIMPGPGMWLDSLSSAAKLPKLAPENIVWDARAPGADTASAILNGAALGLAGAVKEAVRRLLMAMPGSVPMLVFTGGWGEKLLPALPGKHVPDLVLRGLDILACRARPH